MTQTNDAFDEQISRYLIGIDLGTTNCAVAYIDSDSEDDGIQIFQIEQPVDWSLVESRDTLPSFRYQLTPPESNEAKSNAFERSGDLTTTVGVLARDRGTQMPGRQVLSAKSWLSHNGVDRRADMLPWQCDEDVEQVSPIRASADYLTRIRKSWDAKFRKHPMAEQDIVLTLPASFDEIARELTIEAAKLAGLARVHLLEEPQAALYSWLEQHESDWTKRIEAGQSILVCDIGGGTTDFTLIRVRQSAAQTNSPPSAKQSQSDTLSTDQSSDDSAASKDQRELHSNETLSLHRVAVGQHLILGGDNLDLALAKSIEQDLANDRKSLSAKQWDSLRLACRSAKESLLTQGAQSEYTLNIAGSGSKLISQSISININKDRVDSVLLDGFFPLTDLTERPVTEASGFQEFGLPYASDPAITKHLASFLWDNRWVGRDVDQPVEADESKERLAARPDWILFNGGVLESNEIADRLTRQINSWFDENSSNKWSVGVLSNPRLDLAVARGAAYFAKVRRGEGVRIDARSARSFYLQITQDPPTAICLMPAAVDSGEVFSLNESPMELKLGQPTQFPLWFSSLRATDRPGHIVDIDPEQLRPLPPIRTVLESDRSKRQQTIPVHLEIELTEIGTLQTFVVSNKDGCRWKLDFDIRSSIETDRIGHTSIGESEGIFSQDKTESALTAIRECFSNNGQLQPKKLQKTISSAIELSRENWPPTLLRAIWHELIELGDSRQKSAAHESRWLNLVGYSLRPGFGIAADDWRVSTTWRNVRGKLIHRSPEISSAAIVLWRRICGGFTAGQQQALFQELRSKVNSALSIKKSTPNLSMSDAAETIRLAGSLEWLPAVTRREIGDNCLKRLQRKIDHPLGGTMLWTIGRIGARVPAYGPLHLLIASEVVEGWIESLLQLETNFSEQQFALMQLSRKTNDRYRDIGEPVRKRVLQWMRDRNVKSTTIDLIENGGDLSTDQLSESLGESMPLGLSIK